MQRRNILRVGLLVALVVSAGNLVAAWLGTPMDAITAAEEETAKPLAERTPVVDDQDGATVITTDPPGGSDGLGAIVAFGADGRPLYHNDTYGNYFDVDPDPPARRPFSTSREVGTIRAPTTSRHGRLPPSTTIVRRS